MPTTTDQHNVNVTLDWAHYRTVPLMRSVHQILLKQMRLKQMTEAGDGEIWITQIVALRIPDGRTNQRQKHDGHTCPAESVARSVGGGWPNLRRCCCWATGVQSWDRWSSSTQLWWHLRTEYQRYMCW